MIGSPKKVLAEVASVISEVETGEVTITWSTINGAAVVESFMTVRVEATTKGRPAPPQAGEASDKPLGERALKAVGQAFRDSWTAVFPPQNKGR